MNQQTQANNPRRFSGTVTSTKMEHTLIVRVERTMVHPKYGKRYVLSKNYPVHTDHEGYRVGDTVQFQESRPYSKTVRWRVIGKPTNVS